MTFKPNLLTDSMKQGLAVGVGVAALLYFYVSHKIVVTKGNSVTLAVEGYDPRDLLSGYYLRYRIKYEANLCEQQEGEVCACLGMKETGIFKAWAKPCNEAPAACSAFIRGSCSTGQFRAGIERYYIPEDKRHSVPVIPEGATISVRVDKSGKAVTEGFSIKGQSLEDYLIENSE